MALSCACADGERSGTLWEMLQEDQDLPYERQQNILHYNIDDRDSWLRTVDYTPSNAFGRSFACRQVPSAGYCKRLVDPKICMHACPPKCTRQCSSRHCVQRST